MTAVLNSVEINITTWSRVLPKDLRQNRAWLLWTLRPKPGKSDKFDKIPYYTDGKKRYGKNGSPDDRTKLASFDQVLAAYRRAGFDGIGVALLPDVPVWALDLDHCIDAHGKLSELAQRAAGSGSYAERSPSGRGIRALFAGKVGLDKKNHAAGVELFDSRGFVTITGDRIAGQSLRPCPATLLEELLRTVRSRAGRAEIPRTDAPPENPELVKDMRLPMHLWRRLAEPYSPECDRSAVAFGIAVQLAHAGAMPEQVLELMSNPQLLEPALERRSGDIESAREWMWRYVVLPAYAEGV